MLRILWFLVVLLVGNAVIAFEDGKFGSELGSSEDVADFYAKASKESLLWGPYKSNLYLGVSSKIPQSFTAGLMWFNADNYQNVGLIRHQCTQEDDLARFGWVKYDPRTGGRQVIEDSAFSVNITTDFVKTEDGNWALKIKGIPKSQDVKTSIVFYVGLEGEGELRFSGSKMANSDLVDGDVRLVGFSERLDGVFDIEVTEGSRHQYAKKGKLFDATLDPSLTHHVSLRVPDDNIWRAKDLFLTLVQENLKKVQDGIEKLTDVPPEQLFQMKNLGKFDGNMHFIQKTFQGDFEFDVLFNKDVSEQKLDRWNVNTRIADALKTFDDNFISKFQLSAPFNGVEYVNFAKELLSQLMGGIGYFYGDQLVDRDAVIDDVEFTQAALVGKSEGPYELFSAVPSRPFFPRGFYWDEGFHLLPILEYDSDLALEIVKSWFSLIDEDGWIAREVILGDEARSKVPPEFQVQNPNIANPPTLMMVFSELLDIAKRNDHDSMRAIDNQDVISFKERKLGDLHLANPELLASYANEIYPQLQNHYNWFRRTQRGEAKEFERVCHSDSEVFRWKGRTKDHCLPSGIDDYPRCEPDIGELNVDLMSWMGVMTRSMYRIAYLLQKNEDAQEYNRIYHNIVQNLEDLHWSEQEKSYCDVTVNDDDEDEFECHIGYVTLMPFVHKLIPAQSEHLAHIIEAIKDPEQLWTDFGVRSLSKKDPSFHKGEDYWRGPIWINMNYLILEGLAHYGSNPETDKETAKSARELYTQLRENLVHNVFNQYQSSGYAWEQYNDSTGSGQRTRHFLGWTSLVVNIMKMPETIE